MNFELLQPWSTFVMKTKLSPTVLDSMLKLTDEIINTQETDSHKLKAGQIDLQYFVDDKILWREQVMDYLMYGCMTYVEQAYKQSLPNNPQKTENWMTRMTLMWINSQYDNEYFPIHVHSNCSIAAVIYLKTPEILPDRQIYESNNMQDGCIEFINNTSTDQIWSQPNLQIIPQVGDFFIFSSMQRHQVYPFRSPDGKSERRSVSFNAEFSVQMDNQHTYTI
jgi:hypothetical protein